MNIKKSQIDDLNLELELTIAPEDYAESKRKKLAECRRNADFKGFRKGMVPASLVEKVYGERILVEAVNEVVGRSLEDYITSNDLHLLGEPLTSEKQPEVEWVSGNTFTFIFDAATRPELNFEVEAADEIPQYSITVAAEDKTKMIENLKKYNEEKSDEEIEKDATERLHNEFKQESDWRLTKDIREFYVAKANVSLPEEFLKRWLMAANEGKVSKEDLEKEFPGFLEDFKWQLVRNYLMMKFELKIENDELLEAAKSFVKFQYAMYGIADVPEEMLTDAVQNILHDQRQIDRLVEQVEDKKVIDKIKEIVTIKTKKINSKKFREL